MKIWLMLAVGGYLFYSISSSFDKHLMNNGCRPAKTMALKMFLDGAILLLLGILFFDLRFTWQMLADAAILGVIYGLNGMTYFTCLKKAEISKIIPPLESVSLLSVFIFSLIFFEEKATLFNCPGLFLILIGVYAVLSNDGFHFPKRDKALNFLAVAIAVNVLHSLLIKKFVNQSDPLSLAVIMYFFASLFSALCSKIRKPKTTAKKVKAPQLFAAAFFGSIGTFMIYKALSMARATQVYPIAGIESVFIFIIAVLFLKEKFSWHRLIGTAIVFGGIYLIAI